MANRVDPPNDNADGGSPGDPGYVPPTGADTRIAVVTASLSYAFTETQIIAAGGPWSSFKVRVTPVNDAGSGTVAEVEYPPAEGIFTADNGFLTADSSIITADKA